MSSAYLLVSHGSRDPRPAIAMQQLALLVAEKLHLTQKLVGTGYLELAAEPLHQQIKSFAQTAIAVGCRHLKIVPLFLLPGVHVMTDIPHEVAQAQQALSQDILIELQPYLGIHQGLQTFLQKQIASIKAEAWILLSHGSRRPGSQQPVETMAANIGAVAAYWSVAPSLESRVEELVAAGYREIAILPYFLFSGGITDAIAQAINELKLQFPGVSLYLAAPLGVSGELAELIGDLIYT
ncbi:sirohydrochlorin chelatase [Anabaena azotica]|uniref:Sirohydrochlorin chelatase n=1 Tax=Anabaena azotica FACHB-119 TaxID=947527 RepID=A0ABR8D090_9NOST|nr:sirohydrochlorin chelatase [Anabaena azotica]MBD2500337.1 sirohydrochlorin chelatase [Anabaena azotica FACHB-119]